MKLINVLAKEAYDDCHITGSLSVPLVALAAYVKDLPKNTELIVYCAHYDCPASRKAWQLLTDLGFTNVFAYEGGIAEWHQKGYPTEGSCELDYLYEPHKKSEGADKVKSISAEELKKKLESL